MNINSVRQWQLSVTCMLSIQFSSTSQEPTRNLTLIILLIFAVDLCSGISRDSPVTPTVKLWFFIIVFRNM